MKFLDKSIKKFIIFSVLSIIFLFVVISLFTHAYQSWTINTYNFILLILILLTTIITLIFIVSMLIILYTYKKRHVNGALIWIVRLGTKVLLPFIMLVMGLLKKDRDAVRKLYIDINNILVQSGSNKYKAEDILILLPHCLQSSSCVHRVTNNIVNCKRCGKCCIGDILQAADSENIKVRVVTGGTAARNVVKADKPKIILSVACERDLMSGIEDIIRIPVMGVINQRPNGPCNNTMIDLNVFRHSLKSIIKE